MTLKQKILFSSTFVAILAGLAGVMSYNSSGSVSGKYRLKVEEWNKETMILEDVRALVYALKTADKDEIKEARFQLQRYTSLGQRQEAVAKDILQELDAISKIDLSSTEEGEALLHLQKTKEKCLSILAMARQSGFRECQSVGIYTNKVYDTILNWVLVVSILTFFMAIIFGQLIARDLSKAIERLKKWALRMEKGDYSIVGSSSKRKDEFGKLVLTFTHLTESLQKSKIIEEQNGQLEELNMALEKKNDSLDSFVYRVSHDLKAPVVNLQSLLKVIVNQTQNSDNEILHKTLFYMGTTTEKLEQTIYDLLEVSRIERNLEMVWEMVDIKDVLEEVILENSEALEKTKIVLSHRLERVSQVYFSKANLKSLLSNLITNSIKYHSSDRLPKIDLETYNTGDYICLSISDNGIGIDLERHQKKLFGMFNRFHNHVKGSGVGLYIVKKLMESGGGKVEIESEVNVGTTLRLYFVKKEVGEGQLLEESSRAF